MRRRRTKTALAWALGGVCILLAWVIYEEITELSASDPLETPITGEVGEVGPRASPTILSMPDSGSLAVVLERPVFAQSRRPSGRAAEGAAATSIDFTLSGVVISGSERSALIRPTSDGTIQQLRIGESVAGWRLLEIASDRVIVQRDATEAEVFLDFAAPAPPGPRTEIPSTAIPSTDTPTGVSEDEQKMNEAGDSKANSGEATQN